jgi:hypothetical protein
MLTERSFVKSTDSYTEWRLIDTVANSTEESVRSTVAYITPHPGCNSP